MKKIEFIMGMPVIIEVPGKTREEIFQKVFDYFRFVDEKFSPYKKNSEVTKMNDGRLKKKDVSSDMKLVFDLAEKTKKETDGYFDIYRGKYFDPSGIVKGWAINNSAQILRKFGCEDFYVNAGGDIQTSGLNEKRKRWAVGIRNPFNVNENVKVVYLSGEGIATSGTYERGGHIYNPKGRMNSEVFSLSVIGPNVYEADRFATAAFAMGRDGIEFIEKQKPLEGYMINSEGIATMTSRFYEYAVN